LESDLESLLARTEDGIASAGDIGEWHQLAEAVYNSIGDEQADLDEDGEARTLEGQWPILGDAGHVRMVLDGLDVISAQVKAGDPIKDFANFAYDCTQRVEQFADSALRHAGTGGVCASDSSCADAMASALYELGNAQTGFDVDASGTVEREEEATIGCALYYVNQMARMEISVP
jgi:hypothetical protein